QCLTGNGVGGSAAQCRLGRYAQRAAHGLNPILIRGMWGLGDNIYSRPFVRATAAQYEVHLETPWPELYADLDIKFVRGARPLRTQLKNMARQSETLWSKSVPIRQFQIAYPALEWLSIIAALE